MPAKRITFAFPDLLLSAVPFIFDNAVAKATKSNNEYAVN
jgi:hypothetical protein